MGWKTAKVKERTDGRKTEKQKIKQSSRKGERGSER